MILRPYQQEATDAALEWIKRCTEPALIEAPTGAGKSLVASAIAGGYLALSGGKRKVLVTAPTGKLVEQNYAKWLATGNPASIYSASAGRKDMHHQVVFGTPGTIVNGITHFAGQVGMVIMDEAHGLTPTMHKIIDRLREGNKHLRVVGMTATPYRLGRGYIYESHYLRGRVPDDQTKNPYFRQLVYTIDAHHLIECGYLTVPLIGHHDEEINYDTSGLVLNRMGQWDDESVNRAFVGKGRLTSQICANFVEKTRRRMGVMIFAATRQHAKEIADSLPPQWTGVVTGDYTTKQNEATLERFERREIKYLISVEMLTTGFDAPHVDAIVIMRMTESAGLLTQIMGRGLRLHPDKADCLMLDYCGAIEKHFPDGDLFAPEIRAFGASVGEKNIPAECPTCGHVNLFSGRKNDAEYPVNQFGYYEDLAANPIMAPDGITPMPAHYGRRCEGESFVAGLLERCGYRWSCKVCPECQAENDIAAKYCSECRAEIIDPNEKLRLEEVKMQTDPFRLRVEQCGGIKVTHWPGKEGKPDTVRVQYLTESADWVSEWYSPDSESAWAKGRWNKFCTGAFGYATTREQALELAPQARCPERISFQRKTGSKFFDIKALEWPAWQ